MMVDRPEGTSTAPESKEDHELYRILLYYCYIPISDVPALVDFHSRFKEEEDLFLDDEEAKKNGNQATRPRYGGRIRVAPEGLNGVLSGRYTDLLAYEERLREYLSAITVGMAAPAAAADESSALVPRWELDMKYCLLRRDLTVRDQLFEELHVQQTSQVVALVDMNNYFGSSNCSGEEDEKKSGYSGNRRQRRKQERKQQTNQQLVNGEQQRLAQDIFHRSLMEHEAGAEAPHLSPAEWDAKLGALASSKNPNDDTKVVLLDCRNSYESAVGYFQAPGACTVLTNTRKYSELPFVLMDQSEKSLADASHIFMYCTGGVRCERASGFLRTLLDNRLQHENERESCDNAVRKTPEIYQLHGGIQRYLENSSEGLFRGKNFVFDPRRTDPLTANSESPNIVGQCLVCARPHDDYDNGNAPALHREARCCKCRILVLVCDDCRPTVACWGDAQSTNKPKLFCGGLESSGNKCLHMPPVRELRS